MLTNRLHVFTVTVWSFTCCCVVLELALKMLLLLFALFSFLKLFLFSSLICSEMHMLTFTVFTHKRKCTRTDEWTGNTELEQIRRGQSSPFSNCLFLNVDKTKTTQTPRKQNMRSWHENVALRQQIGSVSSLSPSHRDKRNSPPADWELEDGGDQK